MKRKSLLLLPLLCLSGCSLQQDFVRSADSFATEVGNEYLDYVNEDGELTDVQKQIRVNRVRAQQALTQEALNE